MTIGTSALSLARLLWWYGEDDLSDEALQLEPVSVVDIGERAGYLATHPAVADDMWPQKPRKDWPLVLAAIEVLEGHPRPAARRRRRPSTDMPAQLERSDSERWSDPQLRAVAAEIDRRRSLRP